MNKIFADQKSTSKHSNENTHSASDEVNKWLKQNIWRPFIVFKICARVSSTPLCFFALLQWLSKFKKYLPAPNHVITICFQVIHVCFSVVDTVWSIKGRHSDVWLAIMRMLNGAIWGFSEPSWNIFFFLHLKHQSWFWNFGSRVRLAWVWTWGRNASR